MNLEEKMEGKFIDLEERGAKLCVCFVNVIQQKKALQLML